MVATAVILPEGFDQSGIRSSKEYKSSGSRSRSYDRIMTEAVSVGIQQVSGAETDAKGIDPCHMELLCAAVAALDVRPGLFPVDHYTFPNLELDQRAIEKGDDLSVSIAATSIVAEVTLARIMVKFAELYPEYGLTRKGDTERRSMKRPSVTTGRRRFTGSHPEELRGRPSRRMAKSPTEQGEVSPGGDAMSVRRW